MHAVLSRQPTSSTSTRPAPRKSSSFLSLRREKDKERPATPPSQDSRQPLANRSTSYFDAYPRPKGRSRRPSPPPTYTERFHASPRVAFPTFDSDEDLSTPTASYSPSGHYSRTRSRTGPSSKSHWEESGKVPQLRFSESSSTQHTETPPRTPVDYLTSTESFDPFPVVAAPVSGVEAMDALVDGMNGGVNSETSLTMSSRARFGIPGHHPLYQPPLPIPPPGVVLGGGKSRRILPSRRTSPPTDSDEEDSPVIPFTVPRTRQRGRPSSSRTGSNSTIIPPPPISHSPSAPERVPSFPTLFNREAISRPPSAPAAVEIRKSVVPSISDIIRTHAPPEALVRSRPNTARSSSVFSHSQNHATVHEDIEPEPEPLSREEEAELLSRSSIDSVADEVQRTIRNQITVKPAPPAPPSAFIKRHSVMSDTASVLSPRSDPGAASIYSSSAASYHRPASPFDTSNFLSLVKPSPTQEVAQYLRSARLTTLLKLTRAPHASHDNPLTVSLSDLGCSTGYPVVIFLGLGCVRHIMGLYDEMAEFLGLRLITIDRWGLGRTEPRAKSAKGIIQWASVVEEVLDLLHIQQCSVMAHSAGAPYALSFANKLSSRIRGDICLLAPWVGGSESSGYKWLKYVPNGILKTAQAAEWKLQAWMIGKPPTIAYEGIGYNAPSTRPIANRSSSSWGGDSLTVVYPSNAESLPRPSMGSSTFSEYDDLGDFDGRFESMSTLGVGSRLANNDADSKIFVGKRKSSRGFLERLKGSSNSNSEERSPTGRKLKALRSMGSLKGKNSPVRKSEPSSPRLPAALQIEIGLGLDDLNWTNAYDLDRMSTRGDSYSTATTPKMSTSSNGFQSRSDRRRSISFSSPKQALSMPSSPAPSAVTTNFAHRTGSSKYQAALGNALIAASHAESAKGTHNDLLQILNHDNHPWGFSYSSYPHKVRVWYGDKDEKIAENAVRWMERTMGNDRCAVKVVKGADHGLMYRSSVVVDVLEWISAAWRTCTLTFHFLPILH